MKSTSAIVAMSSLLAGGVASAAAAAAPSSPSSPSLSVSLPKSKSEAVTQIRSQRTKRLRNHHNGYRSTGSGSMSRRRRLQLFQISPAPPPPSTINTTIATTAATATPPTTAASKPSGIFDTGGMTSTFTPSESPSSSATSRKSTFPPISTPFSFSMSIIDYVMSDGSMVPSASPSMIYVETYLPTSMSIDLLTLPPNIFLPSLSLPTSIPTYTVSIPESLSPTSMSWDLFPTDDLTLSIPTQIPTSTPTTSPSMLAPVPPPSVPTPSITTPVVETKCDFCTEISMDESAIIPFSDETTCGMAKEIVVQLDSTSEDCELARKAESICCPKTLAPSTTSPIMTTPAPTISWPPTDAPTAPPSSGRRVGLTNWTLWVVVSSCLVTYWVAILGLPL